MTGESLPVKIRRKERRYRGQPSGRPRHLSTPGLSLILRLKAINLRLRYRHFFPMGTSFLKMKCDFTLKAGYRRPLGFFIFKFELLLIPSFPLL